MARARNIKPGFFNNEILADLDPLCRILFAGLWCIADREGRLEDRPKRIKKEILGYDNCDCDVFLQQLHDSGFIVRYQVGGERYIQITKFVQNQNPHKNEKPSEIPPFACEPEPESGEYGASTVQAPEKHSTNRADSLNSDSLNSDSLNSDSLNSDSLNSDNPDSGQVPESRRVRFKKPTVQEIKTYCLERKNTVVPEGFYDFYQSKNWYIGKNKMVDWRAAVRTWEKNQGGGIRGKPPDKGFSFLDPDI